MAEKRKMKTLTIEEKINLISDYSKLNQRELAKKYEIAQATVSNIIKKQKLYEEEYAVGNPKFKNLKRSGSGFQLNELVYKFIQAANKCNTPVSGPIIKSKATQLASIMGLTNFKASDGWLTSFKQRYKFAYRSHCGESVEADNKTCIQWQLKLQDLIKDYTPDCIYTCGEMGLFYKAIPVKSCFTEQAEYKGLKTAKKRVTLLLACSMEGEKLMPLIISTATKSRSFASINFDLNKLNVHYYGHTNAWMTETIFTDWLGKVNGMMVDKNKKIILFLDNFSCHQTSQTFSNIQLAFFPANTISKLQPLDAGIIKAFKSHYRHKLLVSLITFLDIHKQSQEFSKSVSILDAINWTTFAWNSVNCTTISDCFRKVGFVTDEISNLEESVCINNVSTDISDLLTILTETQPSTHEGIMTAEEFVNFDETLPTFIDQALLEEAKVFQNDRTTATTQNVIEEAEPSSDSDVEADDESAISLTEAKNAVLTLRKFANQFEFDFIISLCKAEERIDDMIVTEKLSQLKQPIIWQYLNK